MPYLIFRIRLRAEFFDKISSSDSSKFVWHSFECKTISGGHQNSIWNVWKVEWSAVKVTLDAKKASWKYFPRDSTLKIWFSWKLFEKIQNSPIYNTFLIISNINDLSIFNTHDIMRGVAITYVTTIIIISRTTVICWIRMNWCIAAVCCAIRQMVFFSIITTITIGWIIWNLTIAPHKIFNHSWCILGPGTHHKSVMLQNVHLAHRTRSVLQQPRVHTNIVKFVAKIRDLSNFNANVLDSRSTPIDQFK